MHNRSWLKNKLFALLLLFLVSVSMASEICQEYPKACQCEVKKSAKYVLVHRTPKCGSGTIMHVMRRYFKKYKDVDIMHEIEMTKMAKRFSQNPHSALDIESDVKLIQGHIAYIPFTEPKLEDSYIRFSSIRDPVSRARSLFYYMMLTKRLSPNAKLNECFSTGPCMPSNRSLQISRDEPNFFKKTFDLLDQDIVNYLENVAEHNETTSDQNAVLTLKQRKEIKSLPRRMNANFLTHFFCGEQEICFSGSANQVLEEAKRVIAEKIEIVSPIEHIPASLFYISRMAPQLFGKHSPREFKKKTPIHSDYGSIQREAFTEEVAEAVRAHNFLDVELYEFAEKVYVEKEKACTLLVGKSRKRQQGWWTKIFSLNQKGK